MFNSIFFYKECFKGRSLLRSFQNLNIKQNVKIHGKCLDLGSKNTNPSYYEFINKTKNCEITFSDLNSKDKKILSFDFNKKFPIQNNEFDNILVFNVLEHVYDTKNLLSESYRILKNNGKLYGVVPFLFLYHKDPSDYWRFTHEVLEKLLKETGYKKIKIIKHGTGVFAVINSMYSQRLRFKILIYSSWWLGFILDSFYKKFLKKNKIENIYLGLYFECEK